MTLAHSTHINRNTSREVCQIKATSIRTQAIVLYQNRNQHVPVSSHCPLPKQESACTSVKPLSFTKTGISMYQCQAIVLYQNRNQHVPVSSHCPLPKQESACTSVKPLSFTKNRNQHVPVSSHCPLPKQESACTSVKPLSFTKNCMPCVRNRPQYVCAIQ